jgi:hypothetical protein
MAYQPSLFPNYLTELQTEAAEKKRVRIEELNYVDFLKDFDKDWIERFADVETILEQLHQFPATVRAFKEGELAKPGDLLESLRAWVSLYRQYTGMEKDFFKPYWVPFLKDSMDVFIDLSDKDLPVFETPYYFIGTQKYIKLDLFKSAKDLLKAAKSGLNSRDVFMLRVAKIRKLNTGE